MRSFTSLRQAAENYNGARPQIFLSVDAQLLNARTVYRRRDERINGAGGHAVFLLYQRKLRSGQTILLSEWIGSQERERDASHPDKQSD